VIPYLGNKPIASHEAPDLLEVLKKIEAKGVIDTAHRTREVSGRASWRTACCGMVRDRVPIPTIRRKLQTS
jgi:hypothetical protein